MSESSAAGLKTILATAFHARAELLARLAEESTDCYRLFHGSVEGVSGLTVDRYGDLLLIQSFHHTLTAPELSELTDFYAQHLPGLTPVYNDRSQGNSRIVNALTEELTALAHAPRIGTELGIRYRIQARHAGQDPWLFLDMRAGRRRIQQDAPGKSVLNLFAYTCGIGIAAAKAGAGFVMNIDFSDSSLLVGRENARLNELAVRPRFIKSDAFAALRQLSGIGQPERVRGKRMPHFPRLEPRQFDLVFLDPPRYAKSPFGVVDLINDYPAVFKPALLCTASGGRLYCCNNVAAVERELWLDQLRRSAQKAGRPIRDFTWIAPEADFPSPDGKPPLKILALEV